MVPHFHVPHFRSTRVGEYNKADGCESSKIWIRHLFSHNHSWSNVSGRTENPALHMRSWSLKRDALGKWPTRPCIMIRPLWENDLRAARCMKMMTEQITLSSVLITSVFRCYRYFHRTRWSDHWVAWLPFTDWLNLTSVFPLSHMHGTVVLDFQVASHLCSAAWLFQECDIHFSTSCFHVFDCTSQYASSKSRVNLESIVAAAQFTSSKNFCLKMSLGQWKNTAFAPSSLQFSSSSKLFLHAKNQNVNTANLLNTFHIITLQC